MHADGTVARRARGARAQSRDGFVDIQAVGLRQQREDVLRVLGGDRDRLARLGQLTGQDRRDGRFGERRDRSFVAVPSSGLRECREVGEQFGVNTTLTVKERGQRKLVHHDHHDPMRARNDHVGGRRFRVEHDRRRGRREQQEGTEPDRRDRQEAEPRADRNTSDRDHQRDRRADDTDRDQRTGAEIGGVFHRFAHDHADAERQHQAVGERARARTRQADKDFEEVRGHRWDQDHHGDEENRTGRRGIPRDEQARVLTEQIERRLRNRQPEDADEFEESRNFGAPGTKSGVGHGRRTLPVPRIRPSSAARPCLVERHGRSIYAGWVASSPNSDQSSGLASVYSPITRPSTASHSTKPRKLGGSSAL